MPLDFAKIYDDFSERIYRFGYYKTYNRDTAEDLTSSVFLRALEKQDRFSPERGSLSS